MRRYSPSIKTRWSRRGEFHASQKGCIQHAGDPFTRRSGGDYKRRRSGPRFRPFERPHMTAVYMIVAFIVVFAILNVLATGRLD
jgi:hypothetical protein